MLCGGGPIHHFTPIEVSMLAYTIKRLLTLIPTLLAASILVFLFVHLIPGNPAAILARLRPG